MLRMWNEEDEEKKEKEKQRKYHAKLFETRAKAQGTGDSLMLFLSPHLLNTIMTTMSMRSGEGI